MLYLIIFDLSKECKRVWSRLFSLAEVKAALEVTPPTINVQLILGLAEAVQLFGADFVIQLSARFYAHNKFTHLTGASDLLRYMNEQRQQDENGGLDGAMAERFLKGVLKASQVPLLSGGDTLT